MIEATLCFYHEHCQLPAGRAAPQEVGHGPPDKTEHFLNATLSLPLPLSLSPSPSLSLYPIREEGGTVTNVSSHTPKDAVPGGGNKWVIVSMMR